MKVSSALWLQVKAASKKKDLKLKFHGAVDHLDDSMHEYKVGCSVTQVCCLHWCTSSAGNTLQSVHSISAKSFSVAAQRAVQVSL